MKNNTRYIVMSGALALAAVFSACDGNAEQVTHRENFDFDWSFKYFGTGDP